jgi:hypothetical protein
MRHFVTGGLALVLWTASALAQAQLPEEGIAVAQQLVVRSGLAEQLKSVPQQFDMEVAQARGTEPDHVLDAMAEAARASFRPELLQQDIVEVLAARMPVADMKRAIAWLETSVGRRVTRAEELASSTLTPESLQAHADGLKRKPQTAKRTRLIAELIIATKAIEQTANLIEGVALGMAMGMDSTQPVQNRQGLPTLQARLRSLMPPEQIRLSLAEAVPNLYGYMYREVSDADLAAYLAFNRSTAGTKYNDTLIAAFTEAMLRASMRTGPLIEKSLAKTPA